MKISLLCAAVLLTVPAPSALADAVTPTPIGITLAPQISSPDVALPELSTPIDPVCQIQDNLYATPVSATDSEIGWSAGVVCNLVISRITGGGALYKIGAPDFLLDSKAYGCLACSASGTGNILKDFRLRTFRLKHSVQLTAPPGSVWVPRDLETAVFCTGNGTNVTTCQFTSFAVSE